MSGGSSGAEITAIPVEVWIYDLSQGYASAFSPVILGKRIDGIWHTSIVVFGKEHYYGQTGITCCNPGSTVLGQPLKKEKLGETEVPYDAFIDYLTELGESTFHGSKYSLLKHNCNTFSEELAQFLCGVSIPSYILDLPTDVLNSPFWPQLQTLLEQTIDSPSSHSVLRGRSPSPELQTLNQQIEETRIKSLQLKERRRSIQEKIARRERKKEKKRRKRAFSADPATGALINMAEPQIEDITDDAPLPASDTAPVDIVREIEAEERREREARRRAQDPPIIFKDTPDVQVEFDALVGLVDGKLNEDEQISLEELHQYMLEDEGSWALGENFLNFIGRLLHDKNLPSEVRVRTLNVLSSAALKDDCILVLHQDRREHIVMNYAYEIDRNPLEEQIALALVICNLFENQSSSDWLVYISEWNFCNNQISNIRVTTKVAVHSLLSDNGKLQELGVAIIHNLACKEVKTVVFDDVAVELTMALLQFFQSKPSQEQLFLCLKSLARFTQISGQEVPQLIQMIGPNPNTFKGISDKIDEQIAIINKKMR